MIMNEQDKRAVEGMARCGIDMEGLIASFPNFPVEEIKEVYREIHKSDDDQEPINISINCS